MIGHQWHPVPEGMQEPAGALHLFFQPLAPIRQPRAVGFLPHLNERQERVLRAHPVLHRILEPHEAQGQPDTHSDHGTGAEQPVDGTGSIGGLEGGGE